MLQEITTQIKAQLYDRARSPLWGAFVLAWCAWNFRTLLILFSGDTLELKISILDSIYQTPEIYLTKGLLYPVLSAVVFIVFYPLFARLAYWHWHNQHVKLKATQQKIEDKTPLTQEEANALRKVSLDQEINFQQQIRSLNELNKELTSREQPLINRIREQDTRLEILENALREKSQEVERPTAYI